MSSLVWLASRRDLLWRRRRFVIAVGAIILVLALTLLPSGFRDGIDVETARTVEAFGGDAFVVRDGVSGPFTTVSQLDDEVTEVLAGAPGVVRADPIVSVRHAIESAPVTDVYLIGSAPVAWASRRSATGVPLRSPAKPSSTPAPGAASATGSG